MASPPNPYAGMKHPSREIVSEYLDYDPQTGVFRWKQLAAYRRKPGEIAGAVRNSGRDKTGHRHINIFGHRYPATHIAWLLMTGEWPSRQIDHKNNIGTDDRWTNLRLATQLQNIMNNSVRSDNTSGYKGVHPYKRGKRSKWVTQIGDRHIGYFQTAEEAARAYDREAIKTFGEFAYLNFPDDDGGGKPVERHVHVR